MEVVNVVGVKAVEMMLEVVLEGAESAREGT